MNELHRKSRCQLPLCTINSQFQNPATMYVLCTRRSAISLCHKTRCWSHCGNHASVAVNGIIFCARSKLRPAAPPPLLSRPQHLRRCRVLPPARRQRPEQRTRRGRDGATVQTRIVATDIGRAVRAAVLEEEGAALKSACPRPRSVRQLLIDCAHIQSGSESNLESGEGKGGAGG